ASGCSASVGGSASVGSPSVGCSGASGAGAVALSTAGSAVPSPTCSAGAWSCSACTSEGCSGSVFRSLASTLLPGLDRLRLLGLVRVVGTPIHLQLAELLTPEPVSRQHAPHRQTDDLLRALVEHLVQCAGAE